MRCSKGPCSRPSVVAGAGCVLRQGLERARWYDSGDIVTRLEIVLVRASEHVPHSYILGGALDQLLCSSCKQENVASQSKGSDVRVLIATARVL